MAYLHYWARTRIPVRVRISIPKMSPVFIGSPSPDTIVIVHSDSVQRENVLHSTV